MWTPDFSHLYVLFEPCRFSPAFIVMSFILLGRLSFGFWSVALGICGPFNHYSALMLGEEAGGFVSIPLHPKSVGFEDQGSVQAT